MIKISCDKCGKEMDYANRAIAHLPEIKFNIETVAIGAGPNNTDIKTQHPFITVNEPYGADGRAFTCQFNTTNTHFCEHCIFVAFYKGVQDEFLRRQAVAASEAKCGTTSVSVADPAAASFDLQPKGNNPS